MAASEFQKKAISFIVIFAAMSIALVGVSFVETWLQTDFLPGFGYEFKPDANWELIQPRPEESRTIPDVTRTTPVRKPTTARPQATPAIVNTTPEATPEVLATTPEVSRATSDMTRATYVGLFANFFHILKILLWMILIISFVRFVTYIVFLAATRNSGQNEISSLIKTVLSIVVYILAFFIIFQTQYPGINLGAIFTGSAILGVVVGLALQETLGNLFAGIALQADQPFQVGDVVNITNRGVGVVETVSWRGVKIRTFQNKLLIISNAVLGKESIEVAPKDNLNARLVFFNTNYSVSPARTAHLVREAIRLAENVSHKMRPIVRIRELGENGIDWEVKYWLDNYAKYNDSDAIVRRNIWYAFQREKVAFAFPTRTLHIEPKAGEITVEEKINKNAERLNNVPIFAPLSDDETERLAHAAKTRIFAPGEPIVRAGQEGKSMFVIVRGQVDVEVTENGSQRTINTLGENDFFGEMSLLTGAVRTATVIATEETEVLRIEKAALKPIFESNPELVETIVQMIDERRKVLDSVADEEDEVATEKKTGVLRSIRKFFGLGSTKHL
jgi:small-conductance mechanosensitive channel